MQLVLTSSEIRRAPEPDRVSLRLQPGYVDQVRESLTSLLHVPLGQGELSALWRNLQIISGQQEGLSGLWELQTNISTSHHNQKLETNILLDDEKSSLMSTAS